MSADTGRRQRIADAIAEAFTTEWGARNPAYDIEQPDGPDNEYHLRRSMSERVQGSPAVHFTAGDGCRSFRTPTCEEIAAVVDAALSDDVKSQTS